VSGAAAQSGHVPVLLRECLAALGAQPGDVYVDATAGLGGHAREFGRCVGLEGMVVLNDVDPRNLDRAREVVGASGTRVEAMAGNFADLPRRLSEAGLSADVVLADLGFSSNQMEDADRGLSFMRDGPLDMRLDPGLPITAAELVNSLPEGELVSMLREFGDEPGASRIARNIVQVRRSSPITTTGQFAEVVRGAIGKGNGRIDPSTRSFQALRIAVNDEMGALDALLASIGRAARAMKDGRPAVWISPGARIGIITFHSLEDRRVKKVFGELVREGVATDISGRGRGGVIEASEAEVQANPRSRSAKLRVIRIAEMTPGTDRV